MAASFRDLRDRNASIVTCLILLNIGSAFSFNLLSLPSRHSALPLSLSKNSPFTYARRSGRTTAFRAMMDPSTIHSAADFLQQDWSAVSSALPHGSDFLNAWNLLADAAAGVIDPMDIKSTAAGTGMTKPGWFDGLGLPSIDPWKTWMGFLQASVFKLREITGSFGLAIIFIVLCVKAVTYPLNYKVYASQFEMQAIQPEIERIKEEFKDNPDLINLRTSVLFQEKSVNPLAGCLPVLIQFPIFIGLYRTFLNLGKERKLEEPFLFLPSLEGPVVAGLPTDYVGVREDAPWLLQNWVDGHPPLGWHDSLLYCIIPVLLIVVQLASSEITKAGQPKKPAAQQGDGSIETLVAVLPYLIGWFALNLPSGCALYWLVNTVFTIAQQVYIKSLFKPQLEAAAASAAAHSADAPAIVTDAERKIAEQASQEGWIRGLKEVYKKFDSFLGMGLPSEEDIAKEEASRKQKEEGPNMFQADFWIKEKKNPAALQLKKEEIDEVKAKFLAAREARKASKLAAGGGAAAAPSEAAAVEQTTVPQ